MRTYPALRIGIVAALSVALASCATSEDQSVSAPPPPLMSPPPPPPVPAPERDGGFETMFEAVSDMLVRGEGRFEDIDGYPVKGLVLLDADSGSRNKRVCEAFTKLTPRETAELFSNADDTFAPLFWPVTSEPEDRSDCDDLLAVYDFEMAKFYMNKPAIRVEGGPVIWAHDAQGRAALLDLSKAGKDQTRALVPAFANAMVANDMANLNPRVERNIFGVNLPSCDADSVTPENSVIAYYTDLYNGPEGTNLLDRARDLGGSVVGTVLPVSDLAGAAAEQTARFLYCRLS